MLHEKRINTIKQMLEKNPYINFNEIYFELNRMDHLKENFMGKLKEITRHTV